MRREPGRCNRRGLYKQCGPGYPVAGALLQQKVHVQPLIMTIWTVTGSNVSVTVNANGASG